MTCCLHPYSGGRCSTLDGVQEWYLTKQDKERDDQATKSHACVLFADLDLLNSYAETLKLNSRVKLFKLFPLACEHDFVAQDAGAKKSAQAKRTSTKDMNNNQAILWSSSVLGTQPSEFDLYITLVHLPIEGDDHALGKKDTTKELGIRLSAQKCRFTSLHIFPPLPERDQRLVYDKLSRVPNWQHLFVDKLLDDCGMSKLGPRSVVHNPDQRQSSRRAAGARDAEFQQRRGEFSEERAHALELGQRADDLFAVQNMALTRSCIGQQVWEDYRDWHRDSGGAEPFRDCETFERFLSERQTKPLLTRSWSRDGSDALLNIGKAVEKMREQETINHWLAHLYRLEVDFLTEKMGQVVVTHQCVCDAVSQRVNGEGGAAETSHALFSLAVGTEILAAKRVAEACSGICLFRKVHFETTEGTNALFKSPSAPSQGPSEALGAQRMEIDGDGDGCGSS